MTGYDTYHAPSAPRMIHLLLAEQLDMVNGVRINELATLPIAPDINWASR